MFFGYHIALGLLQACFCYAATVPDFNDLKKSVHDRKVPNFLYCPLRPLVNRKPNGGYRPQYASVEYTKGAIKSTCGTSTRNKNTGYYECFDAATYYGDNHYKKEVKITFAYDFQKKFFWNDWVWKGGKTDYVS